MYLASFPDGIPDGTHIQSFDAVLTSWIEEMVRKYKVNRVPQKVHDAQAILRDFDGKLPYSGTLRKNARIDAFGHLQLNVLKGATGLRITSVSRQYSTFET